MTDATANTKPNESRCLTTHRTKSLKDLLKLFIFKKLKVILFLKYHSFQRLKKSHFNVLFPIRLPANFSAILLIIPYGPIAYPLPPHFGQVIGIENTVALSSMSKASNTCPQQEHLNQVFPRTICLCTD